MKFGELIKMREDTSYITPRHEAWLVENGNPHYSDEAIAFGTNEFLAQRTPRDRRGSVSASSLNSCPRRQQFKFIGMPELLPPAKTAGIFQNGTFMHIRWQMAGLTEGWMAEGEVPVPKPNRWNLSGTQDGVADDNSVLEFKSINSFGYRSLEFGPKEDHKFQVGTYMVVTGREKAYVIYENKDTQDFKEFVVHRDDKLEAEVTRLADMMWTEIEAKKLFQVLSDCEAHTGFQYRFCEYRNVCMETKTWRGAERKARESRSDD